MRELEGRSYDEIAAQLGASNGAVRQLLNRARASLRERLGALIPAELVVRWLSLATGSYPSRALTLAGTGALGAKISSAILLSEAPVVALTTAPRPAAPAPTRPAARIAHHAYHASHARATPHLRSGVTTIAVTARGSREVTTPRRRPSSPRDGGVQPRPMRPLAASSPRGIGCGKSIDRHQFN
jgi:hypothetical protein